MKIEIDITEFYLEEEDNLEQGLRDYIKRDVICQIEKSIREKVQNQILIEVKHVVEQNLQNKISTAIAETIATCKMQSKNERNKEVTMEEYVKECFFSNNSYNSFDEIIKKIASSFAVELKSRYDLLFASQLVAKMSDSGLLKDDIANLLLKS